MIQENKSYVYDHSEGKIAKKLILYLVIASSVITLITTSIQLIRDYNADISLIENSVDQIESVYLPTVASTLWITDREEIQLILDGIIRIRDIQYAAVFEGDNEFASSGVADSKNIIKKKFTLNYRHRGELLEIGVLQIIASLGGVYQRLIDRVWVILLSNGVKTFLVAGFMLFIFQSLVTKHIKTLAIHAVNLNLHSLNKLPVLRRKKSKKDSSGDELDVLVGAFVLMQRNMSNALKLIHSREEKLRLYENIISATSDLMSYVDRDYVYRAVNIAYTHSFGKPVEEIVDRPLEEVLGRDFFYSVIKPRMELAFQGKRITFTTLFPNSDSKYMEVNFYPYRDEHDVIKGVVVNGRDISERIIAEREQAKLTAIIENSHDLMAITKLDSEVVYINEAGIKLIGSDKLKEEYSLQLNQILANPEILTSCVQKGHWIGETEIKTRCGKSVPVVADVCCIKDPESGYPMNIAVVLHDVSERNKVLRELRISRDNLDSLVKARTRELTNANRELEAFAYSVSHDLRAPLRAINGFSQILQEECGEKLNTEQNSHIERILGASVKMGELIDSLLRLSRITRQNIDLKDVNLSTLCSSVVENINGYQESQNVEFFIQDEMFQKCDEKLIYIAYENLISNAIKYSKMRSKSEIQIGKKVDSNNNIYFVKDNGIGFEMRFAEKIFLPFRRLHDEDEYDGIGIGLATVYRIIDKHAGKLWVESEPNKGSTFYFTINL